MLQFNKKNRQKGPLQRMASKSLKKNTYTEKKKNQ